LAFQPDVVLKDESASALDLPANARLEGLTSIVEAYTRSAVPRVLSNPYGNTSMVPVFDPRELERIGQQVTSVIEEVIYVVPRKNGRQDLGGPLRNF
jgi:hypothetical protein